MLLNFSVQPKKVKKTTTLQWLNCLSPNGIIDKPFKRGLVWSVKFSESNYCYEFFVRFVGCDHVEYIFYFLKVTAYQLCPWTPTAVQTSYYW